MEGSDCELAKFTVPILKAFLKACSQNVSGNKQSLVTRPLDAEKHFFFLELTIFWSADKQCKDPFFPHPPSPFPRNCCEHNSSGICTVPQF